MKVKHQLVLRLAAYWGTILATMWGLAFMFAYGTEKGREWYREELSDPVSSSTNLDNHSDQLAFSHSICRFSPTLTLEAAPALASSL
jgi:hypothetical protein